MVHVKLPSKKRLFILLLLLLCAGAGVSAQEGGGASKAIRFEDAQADDLFRQGVMRFHDSYHSEAAVLFQRVLSLQPDNFLARVWLGKAYYYAGFESSALQEWSAVRAQGEGSPELTAFMEAYQARRGLSRDFSEDAQYFPVMTLEKVDSRPYQFRRPAGILPLADGTSWVCGFANNILVKLGPSGHPIRGISGSPSHLSGPFDLVQVDNKDLYITQMVSNSVTHMDADGNFKSSFGTKGSKDGQFLGPQYIAWDGGIYLYVSDMGNRRISKFDRDGNFILSMGQRSSAFSGLERPVGLAWWQDRLIVADASRQHPALYFFDASGNLLDSLESQALVEVESIGPYENGTFLVCTRSTVLVLDPVNMELSPLIQAENSKTRLVSARMDANGHVITSDFDQETIVYNSRLSGVYSGISVQIQRVVADKFPEIVVECNVMDSRGLPVLGLSKENFTLTEGHKPLNDFTFLGSGSKEDSLDVIILVQGGSYLEEPRNREALSNAVDGISKSFGSRARIGLVSTGLQSGLEARLGSSAKDLAVALEGLAHDSAWYPDQGIRMAVSQLAKAPGLRQVIFVGDGTLQEDAFKQFGLEEDLRYLQNNRIRFSMVNTGETPIDSGLSYLVRESGGRSFPLYAPQGLQSLGNELAVLKDGVYRFSFRTLFDSDFGRKYLPVEVQAGLFQKSGRDESGYFGPLRTEVKAHGSTEAQKSSH